MRIGEFETAGGGGAKTELKFSSSPLMPDRCSLSFLRLVPLLPNQHMLPPLLSSPLCPWPSLALLADHLEQGLQQSVISVPVRLVAVEAIGVVTVDIVLGAPVPVDHIQSLVQCLRGESRHRDGEASPWLLFPPSGGPPASGLGLLQGGRQPVEGHLKETQQGLRGGGG